jgi:UDP:flavonoid glycosyltransferase YjiC (YdhE family)
MTGRILMVTTGSFGDVNPFVGLALALKARGYRPVIVSHTFWREWIESAGIECEAFDWDIPPLDNLAQWVNPLFLTRPAADGYRRLADIVRSDDVLMSLAMLGLGPLMAAPLVAESRGVPWIAVILEPLSFFSAHETLVLPSFAGQPPTPSTGPAVQGSPLWWYQNVYSFECLCLRAMGAAMAALRPSVGLPPVNRDGLTDFRHADLVLAPFSRLLAPPQPDWPQQVRSTGFLFHDGYQRQPLAPELDRFLNNGPPPVVFTLSSDALAAPDPDFWMKCTLAARAVERRAVIVGLTVPGHADVIVPDGYPDICIVPSASFATLFPHATAIVHHGGIGTTALALRAGKPMLVIPGEYSQPDTAARLERLGVARVILRTQFNGASAAAELSALLVTPGYRQAARRAAAVITREDGANSACDAIEALLRARQTLSPGSDNLTSRLVRTQTG